MAAGFAEYGVRPYTGQHEDKTIVNLHAWKHFRHGLDPHIIESALVSAGYHMIEGKWVNMRLVTPLRPKPKPTPQYVEFKRAMREYAESPEGKLAAERQAEYKPQTEYARIVDELLHATWRCIEEEIHYGARARDFLEGKISSGIEGS